MGNMEIWNKVKRPPETALKSIAAGRLKGKTDISPQWRYQALTEVLGPCGIGWKYEIKRLWTEQGSHDQVMAFSEVLLWVKVDGAWSEPIPGVGGASLIAKESSGLHSNDEGYKMAVTDALSVALKMIGVAADIYLGAWDGSKYRELEKKDTKPALTPENGKAWGRAINVYLSEGSLDNVKKHMSLTDANETKLIKDAEALRASREENAVA